MPAGWSAQSHPPGKTDLLTMSHAAKGTGGWVRSEPRAMNFGTGPVPDWDAYLGAARAAGERRETGTCRAFPAALVVHPPTASVSYYVLTPHRLWRVRWECAPQDFPALSPLFETCCKGFAPPEGAAPAAAPAARPSRLGEWFPSVHQDPKVGFSVPVPKGWKAVKKARVGIAAEVLTLTDESFKTGTMRVRVDAVPQGAMNWETCLDATRGADWVDVKIEERIPSTCSGHAALKVRWRYRVGEVPWIKVAYYVAAPSTLYRLEGDFWPQNYRMAAALVDVCVSEFTVLEKQ